MKKLLLVLALFGCNYEKASNTPVPPQDKKELTTVTFMCTWGLNKCLETAKTLCTSCKDKEGRSFLMGNVNYIGSKDYLITCEAPYSVYYLHGIGDKRTDKQDAN